MKELILASASSRRADILQQIHIPFRQVPSDFDEDSIIIEDPKRYVMTLAEQKAESVSCSMEGDHLILGADTVVVYNHKILEKPKNVEEARNFMKMLSGNTHQVITGVCLIDTKNNRKKISFSTTQVSFRILEEQEIEHYISTKEPYDKAGGYGIQGIGARFVKEIEGDYTNVVGLPVYEVLKIMKELGAPTL